MKAILLLLISFTSIFNLYAQEYSLSGRILDSLKRTPLKSANVLLTNIKDKTQKGVYSDNEGKFLLLNILKGQYSLKISYVGYRNHQRPIAVKDKDINIKNIYLSPDSIVLNEVISEAEAPPMEQKGDTTQYHASAYKVHEDATSEDLVKKMPGITVDNRTGKVESQGEEVRKVLIDKKPFLGNNARAALKNLPAKLVKKVQVFDEKSDQAMFTGIPDGQTIKVINLETKFTGGIKEAQYNKFSAGYGTDDKYILSGHYTRFGNTGKVAIYGQMNNINNNGFTFENDQVSSVYNFRNSRNMDSKVNSLGASYTNSYYGDFQFTGNYSLSYGKSNIERKVERDYNEVSGIKQFYSENSNSGAKTLYHKLDFKMKYAYDSMTGITFIPNAIYQANDVNSFFSAGNYLNDKISSEMGNNSLNEKKIKNISGNLLINRLLSATGNSLSLNIRANYIDNDGTEKRNSSRKIYNNIPNEIASLNNVESYSESNILYSNLLYTHPLTDESRMQTGYYITYNKNNTDKRDFGLVSGSPALDSSFSNIFDSRYWTHRAGGKYYFSDNSFKIDAGIYYNINKYDKEHALPYIYSNNRTYKNLLPEVNFELKNTTGYICRFSYSATASIPSPEQIQKYVDRTNTFLLSAGNPDLKESITHSFSLVLYPAFLGVLNSTSLMISSGITKDYIGSNSIFAVNDTSVMDNIELLRGSRITYPVNLDNRININSRIYISFHSSLIDVSPRIYFNYLKVPYSVNNEILYSYSRTAGTNIILGTTSYVEEMYAGLFLDFKYISSTNSSSRVDSYYDLYANFNFEYRFPENILFQADLNYQYYSGMYSDMNSKDINVNLSLAKKFFSQKQLELKLMVYDLFNKSKPIQKRITDLYIEDTYTKAPKRCIMLSITYDMKTFSGNM